MNKIILIATSDTLRDIFVGWLKTKKIGNRMPTKMCIYTISYTGQHKCWEHFTVDENAWRNMENSMPAKLPFFSVLFAPFSDLNFISCNYQIVTLKKCVDCVPLCVFSILLLASLRSNCDKWKCACSSHARTWNRTEFGLCSEENEWKTERKLLPPHGHIGFVCSVRVSRTLCSLHAFRC